ARYPARSKGFLVFAALAGLAVPSAASGDDGGGGGRGGTPPPPAAAPAVTFTPTSLTFAAQAIGTTRQPQSTTVANTGNVPVFVNNFFSTSFLASGGTAPYTWSGQVPAGLTLRSSGPPRRAERQGRLHVHGDRHRCDRSNGDGHVLAHRHRRAAADPAWLPDR